MNWLREGELGEKIQDEPATIYIIRHGETELNGNQKLRGWVDCELDDVGQKQAKKISKFFSDIELSRIYSSDFKRAVSTAEPLSEMTGVDINETEGLRPIDFGDWNGESLKEIEPDLQKLQNEWMNNPDKEAPNGESFTSFQDRCSLCFDSIIKDIKPGERIALVAHLRNCVYLLSYIWNGCEKLKGKQIANLNNITQEVAAISVIKYSKDKNEMQISINNQIGNPLEEE